MEESLRRQYLEAMGIQNWVGREVAPEPVVVQVLQEDLSPETKPMPTVTEKGTHLFFEGKTEEKIDASPFSLNWDELRSQVESCKACELHKTRTQAVFGVPRWSPIR